MASSAGSTSVIGASAEQRHVGFTTAMPFIKETAVETKGHFPSLDGVRGFAVLLVFLYHAFSSRLLGNTAPARVTHWITMRCWVGVDLFFVLSGFLITGILLRSTVATNYYTVFYLRRALRIPPLYYAVMVTVFALHGLRGVPFQVQLFYWLNLSNLVSAFHPFWIPALVHYWSLGIEEQFYFVWPLLVRKIEARGLALVCMGTMIGCSLLRNIPPVLQWNHRWGDFVYRLTPFRVDTLCAGALLAILLRQGFDLNKLRLYVWGTLVASGAGFLLISSYGVDPMVRGGFTLLVICSTALVTLALDQKGVVGRVFSHPFLRRCGKYSYCFYLVHPFVLMLAPLMASLLARLHAPQIHPSLSDLLIVLFLFAVSFTISAFSWRYFEKPILALKSYYPYHLPGVGVTPPAESYLLEVTTRRPGLGLGHLL